MTTGYVYPGRVVGMDPQGPIVIVPLLAQSAKWGPLPTSVPDLAVGEQVIVTSLGTSRDQLVIIGRLPGRAPGIDEIPDLAATLDSHDVRLEAVELDNNTDQAVLDDHGTRIGAVEVKNTQQDDRLTAAEGVNTTQNGRLTATEGVANGAASSATTANTAVGTLRADTAGKATTKGDLLAATGAGVLARQGVGANGLVLVADSAQTTGLAYAERRGTALGLTGAVTPTRYVGATTAGAPTTGTFAVGDWVVDAVTGVHWTCTVAGTPGTWTNPGLSRPIGHTGMTGGFLACSGVGAYCTFPTAQTLRGGITHNAGQNALVVGKTGLHRITAKGYFTGGTNYQALTYVTRNDAALPPAAGNVIALALSWKADAGDYTSLVHEDRPLTAGDLIRLYVQGTSNTYGTDGYNGSYLELEYLDQ